MRGKTITRTRTHVRISHVTSVLEIVVVIAAETAGLGVTGHATAVGTAVTEDETAVGTETVTETAVGNDSDQLLDHPLPSTKILCGETAGTTFACQQFSVTFS
eukprot:3246587-Rhodomonas_salina.1